MSRGCEWDCSCVRLSVALPGVEARLPGSVGEVTLLLMGEGFGGMPNESDDDRTMSSQPILMKEAS